MAIAIWQTGRRLFSTAAVLMILNALVHTAANLASAPDDPALQKAFEGMSNYRAALGLGMNPSLQDVYWTFVFIMSITFAALGVINLVLAANPDTPPRLLRSVSWVNALWVGAYLILSWSYRIPPGLISGVIIELAVVAALLAPGRVSREVSQA